MVVGFKPQDTQNVKVNKNGLLLDYLCLHETWANCRNHGPLAGNHNAGVGHLRQAVATEHHPTELHQFHRLALRLSGGVEAYQEAHDSGN